MATSMRAVRDILRVKFWLSSSTSRTSGSFDCDRVVRASKHVAIAERAARESIVLLKNEGGCCRWKKDLKVSLYRTLATTRAGGLVYARRTRFVTRCGHPRKLGPRCRGGVSEVARLTTVSGERVLSWSRRVTSRAALLRPWLAARG